MMRALLALAAFALPASLSAQEPVGPSGSIVGQVVKAVTGEPLAGAIVEVAGQDRRVTTGINGRFAIQGLAPGLYAVRIAAIGYEPLVLAEVVVGSAKPATIAVTLTERPFQLAEVEVKAPYFQPPTDASTSTQILTAEDVRRAPGVQEDVVRAVALLPGVGITTAGRNDLVVRGGSPYENLFLVDNIEVPNINHFGTQGSTGGPLSLVNIDFVQQARFSSGGLDAKFGDRTSSVTSITLREGIEDRLSGEVNLSTTSFGAWVEGPMGKGNFLVGLRRSYLDLVFSLAGFSFVPTYYDLTAKATQRLGTAGNLSFLFLGAIDDITLNNESADDRFDNSSLLATDQRQYFTGLTWSRPGARSLLSVTLARTWTRFFSYQIDSLVPPDTLFNNRSTEGENSLRAELAHEFSPRFSLTVGNVARYAPGLSYDILLRGVVRLDDNGVPRPLRVDTSYSAFRNATYAQGTWSATSRLQLNAGLRGDYYGFADHGYRVSPRLAATLGLDRVGATSIALSLGRYYQPAQYIWLVGSPENGQLSPLRADQAVLQFRRLLRPDFQLQVEAFYKRYNGYPARVWRPEAVLQPSGFDDVKNDIPFGLEPLASEGTGYSYGLEVFAQKRLSEIPVYGLASLSLGRSYFTSLAGESLPGAFDAPVIGTILVGYRPNPKWEFSSKFRIATGLPTTPFIESGPQTGRLDFAQYNAGPRLPTFNALDVRVDRRWSFRKTQLITYIDIQNIYGRKNVNQIVWDQRTQAPTGNESIGILPSIGINFEF